MEDQSSIVRTVAELTDFAAGACARYIDLAGIGGLSSRVEELRVVIAEIPPDDPLLAACLSNLGVVMTELFHRTSDTEILRNSFHANQIAVSIAVSGDPDRARYLSNLAGAFRAVYAYSSDLAALRQAIQCLDAAVAETTPEDPNVTTYLHNLGTALLRWYERTGDVAAHKTSIVTLASAVGLMTSSDPAHAETLGKFAEAWQQWADSQQTTCVDDRSAQLRDVATALHRWSWEAEDSTILQAAVDVARAALAATPDDAAERAHYLTTLTDTLLARSSRAEGAAAHREAVAEISAAVHKTPANHPDRAQILSCLGVAQDQLYFRTHNETDIANAAQTWREVLTALPPGQDARAGVISHLSNSLLAMFGQSQKIEDLDEAIVLTRDAIAATPDETPEHPLLRSNLGNMLLARSKTTDDPYGLREALAQLCAAVADNSAEELRFALVDNLGQALKHLPESATHPAPLHQAVTDIIDELPSTIEQANRLTRLSWAFGLLYEEIKDPALVEERVRLGRAAVAASATDRAASAPHSSELGNSLMLLFSQTQRTTLLEEAIAAHHAAVDVSQPEHRHISLNNLGVALQASAIMADDPDMLREAVVTLAASIEATPADHPERPQRLGFLHANLDVLYHATHAVADLEEAVRIGRATIAALPAEHPDRAHCLRRHGSLVMDLLEWNGDAATAREAVTQLTAAEAATAVDHPDRVSILSDLSRALQVLFERTGDLLLLDQAAQTSRAAIAAASTDHPRRASALDIYSGILRTAFERTDYRPFIEEAVETSRAAVAALSEDRHERQVYLNNLSLHLVLLGESTHDRSALEEAVDIRSAVLAETPSDHPNRALRLINLSGAMTKLFGRTKRPALLDEAVELCRQAMSLALDDSALLPLLEYNFGAVVSKLTFSTGREALFSEARAALRDAASSPMAPISLQIKAGRLLASLENSAGAHISAMRALERAVELMPLVAPRGLMRADRVYLLRQQSGLARDIASIGVAAGHPEWAVELLEQTRGLLIGETVYERRDLAELNRIAPALAAEFEEVRRRAAELELTEPSREIIEPDYVPERPALDVANERRALDQQWTEVLRRIRALDQFTRFLQPPAISALREAAAEGPIVLCYMGDDPGGGALIVTSDPDQPVQVIQLPGLTPDDLAYRVVQLLRALDIAATGDDLVQRQAAQQNIHEVLAWQWDTIAAPVLNHLGVTEITAQRPRIWWSPIGSLALLPLHASGYHDGSARTVLDRTISSYTATIGALWYSRAQRTTSDARAALLVAMPATPDAASLPGADVETQRVARLLTDPIILRGSAATYASVTDALRSHSIAHFACHAQTDRDNPAVSYIVLHDHRTQPLTVNALVGLNLADADLAYLSACSTTSTHPNTADEAIHLVAATQLGGYRHVIGTMWAVNDHAALDVATSFYEILTNQGTSRPHTERSAEALNEAIRRQRDAYPKLPTRWAAHLHYGA